MPSRPPHDLGICFWARARPIGGRLARFCRPPRRDCHALRSSLHPKDTACCRSLLTPALCRPETTPDHTPPAGARRTGSASGPTEEPSAECRGSEYTSRALRNSIHDFRSRRVQTLGRCDRRCSAAWSPSLRPISAPHWSSFLPRASRPAATTERSSRCLPYPEASVAPPSCCPQRARDTLCPSGRPLPRWCCSRRAGLSSSRPPGLCVTGRVSHRY